MTELLITNRKSLCVFFVVSTVMMIVLGVSWWTTRQSVAAYSVARDNFSQKHRQTYREIDEVEYLAANFSDFNRLQDSGVIGLVDPIVWVEAFENIRQKMALDEFYYDIGPPASVAGTPGDSLVVQISTIELRVELVHDESLFQFFKLLEGSVAATYEVDALEIERISVNTDADSSDQQESEKLIASSRIKWLSILPSLAKITDGLKGA